MNRLRIAGAAVLLLAAAEAARAEPVDYPCDGVVVVGRVAHQTFTMLPKDPNDLIGHGRIDFDVNVRKVLRGRETRRTIPARAVAHTYMRESIDFLMIFKATSDGRYEVVEGEVLTPGQGQPDLALQCSTGRPD